MRRILPWTAAACSIAASALFLSSCASGAPEQNDEYDMDDYMVFYATYLQQCRDDLEARYGRVADGSAEAYQQVAICDAEFQSLGIPIPQP
jgi:hypothetical protein